MLLDFSHKGQCQVTMHDYTDGILQAYDLAIKDHYNGYQIFEKFHAKTSAAPDNLFVVNENCKKLSNEAAAAFHTIVAKALYVTKRARLDIGLAIAFLTAQVRSPDIEDWEKLHHLMEYLRGDRENLSYWARIMRECSCGMSMLYFLCIQTCAGIPIAE
jgi:hypothetical protein